MKQTPYTNTIASEIDKFSKLHQTWWDQNGPLKPLHDINPLRLNWINDQVSLQDKQVLDIGCGGGILSESMAQIGAKVTAIDPALPLIKMAKQHASENHLTIDYQCLEAQTLLQAPKRPQFDVVTCMELLEHVKNPSQLIDHCSQLIKPDGYIFVSTINRNWQSYLFAIIGAEYILRLLPKGTHQYNKFIKPHELNHWAEAVYLKLTAIKGLMYYPLSKHYALTDNTKVNYMACLRPTTR